jgi:hypothetical protein
VVFLDFRHFSTKMAKFLGFKKHVFFKDLKNIQDGGDIVDGTEVDCFDFLAMNPVASVASNQFSSTTPF